MQKCYNLFRKVATFMFEIKLFLTEKIFKYYAIQNCEELVISSENWSIVEQKYIKENSRYKGFKNLENAIDFLTHKQIEKDEYVDVKELTELEKEKEDLKEKLNGLPDNLIKWAILFLLKYKVNIIKSITIVIATQNKKGKIKSLKDLEEVKNNYIRKYEKERPLIKNNYEKVAQLFKFVYKNLDY